MAEITAQQKDFITQRAQGCCEYCWSQLKFSPDPFSIELWVCLVIRVREET